MLHLMYYNYMLFMLYMLYNIYAQQTYKFCTYDTTNINNI